MCKVIWTYRVQVSPLAVGWKHPAAQNHCPVPFTAKSNCSNSKGYKVMFIHRTGFARFTSNPSLLPGHQSSVMQSEQPFSS